MDQGGGYEFGSRRWKSLGSSQSCQGRPLDRQACGTSGGLRGPAVGARVTSSSRHLVIQIQLFGSLVVVSGCAFLSNRVTLGSIWWLLGSHLTVLQSGSSSQPVDSGL